MMHKRKKIEKIIISNENKIKINSNEINKGDIFLALKGNNCHGNDFINDCIKKGAIFCITDKKIRIAKNNDKIFFINNLSKFLIDLAKKKRKLFRGKVIGITGSAGKTTLKESLGFCLKLKFKVSYSYKSYNNFLGVIISILNINLNSKFAIFELGTNNFGEIKQLVKYILPSQTIITNIQSTHLENFINKKNIAKEKSSIFNPKYNPYAELLILLRENKEENFLFQIAKKNKLKKIITIGNYNENDCSIKNFKKHKNKYLFKIAINDKIFSFNSDTNIIHRINNLIFCLVIFQYNNLDTNIVIKNINKLKPVVGRGLIYNKKLNNIKIKFIDETYNANPDTMRQSINYFNFIKIKSFEKILILGDMNELGKLSKKFHLEILKYVEKYKFNKVILCGKFFVLAIKKINKPFNQYIIKNDENELIEYIKNNLKKNCIIMAKCSNSTSVNKFGQKIQNINDVH